MNVMPCTLSESWETKKSWGIKENIETFLLNTMRDHWLNLGWGEKAIYRLDDEWNLDTGFQLAKRTNNNLPNFGNFTLKKINLCSLEIDTKLLGRKYDFYCSHMVKKNDIARNKANIKK